MLLVILSIVSVSEDMTRFEGIETILSQQSISFACFPSEDMTRFEGIETLKEILTSDSILIL